MKTFSGQQRQKKRNESWQVIYMDLMTIIMVFFVILWSINQGKDDGISETVGDQTARMVSLPGDILFAAGKNKLTEEGKSVISKLFKDETGTILNFEMSGLVKRMLVIHGHTDGDGKKEENLSLGYERALSAYHEIKKYGEELANHVVICTHADNSAEQEVPIFRGKITNAQRKALQDAKARNRRILVEDKLINKFKEE